MTAAIPGAADEGYRALEWQDLVPPNWEAPIIMPAPAEDGHYPVIPESLVQALDKQKVTLPGYMLPVEYEQNMVFGFLLVPYLAIHTRGHVHHDANQMVYVKLASPFGVKNLAAPYLVSGYIHVQSVTTEDGRTGYTIDRAQIEPYTEIEDQTTTQQ